MQLITFEKPLYNEMMAGEYGAHIWDTYVEMRTRKDQADREAAIASGNAKFLEDIQKPEFAYARSRHFGTTAYMVYPGSPSGVHAGATASNEFARQALAEKNRTAPLSPTEGQHRSGANLNR